MCDMRITTRVMRQLEQRLALANSAGQHDRADELTLTLALIQYMDCARHGATCSLPLQIGGCDCQFDETAALLKRFVDMSERRVAA